MTKQEDFQKELQDKVKVGVKPSQLKRSASMPSKLPSEKNNLSSESVTDQETIINKLKQQKAALLAVNQEAVKQNEQLVKVIDKLQQEKSELVKEKNQLEEALLEKRLELLKTPLTNTAKLPIKRNELEKNILIIFLLVVLASFLLFK